MTLRELLWMYAARRRDRWTHTANVMSLLADCHRDPKRPRPLHVADVLPTDLRATVRRATGIRLTPQNLRLLKPLFEQKS